MGHSPKKESPK